MGPPLPRVTFVIDDLGHGGSQRQLWLAVAALAGRVEMEVVALSSAEESYARRIADAGARVTTIPRRSAIEPGRLRELVRRLRASRAQIVHGMLNASNAYAFLAARMCRLPVVLSLRSDRVDVKGPRAMALRSMFRRADAVTVNTRAGLRHLETSVRVAPSRLVLMPNIVSVTAHPRAADAPVVGCVGRLVEIKRVDAVIAAMSRVRERLPAARLVVVGDGPCRARLEADARRDGVAVEFTGVVDDAAAQIAGFACLVVASRYEGLPNSALEALALGVPVAAVPAGDLPEVVVDGATGALARDASPAALADAITRVLDERLRERAAVEGPRVIRERFSSDRTRDILLNLYQRLQTKTGGVTGE